MRLYDENEIPTHEHEVMVMYSFEVANEILKNGYISRIEVTYVGKNKANVEVFLTGKRGSKKKTLLPFKLDVDKTKDWELVEYAFDEIELEIARKIASVTDNELLEKGVFTVTRKRLHKFASNGINDWFEVSWKK